LKIKRGCSFLPFRFDIKGILLYIIMKCNLEEYAMNAIGEIGNFIITYQEPLQVAAVAALVVGGVVCIGKAIASAGKRQRMLEEISETVAEINTNVKNLNEKHTEVIYIDGRGTPENQTAVSSAGTNKQTAPKEVQTSAAEQEEGEMPGEQKPAAKYFSRDCAVSKDGRKYTIEELDAQIRD
jgi:hypothetical protein